MSSFRWNAVSALAGIKLSFRWNAVSALAGIKSSFRWNAVSALAGSDSYRMITLWDSSLRWNKVELSLECRFSLCWIR